MSSQAEPGSAGDVRNARNLFPATEKVAYFNTAAVGLASRALVAALKGYIDDWSESGLDFARGEAAGESAGPWWRP